MAGAASRSPPSSSGAALPKSITCRGASMPGPVLSTRLSRFTSLAVFAALPFGAPAEDLMQVFRDAQTYDAVYAAARRSLEAGREKGPQGLALLLPSLNLTANAQRQRNELDSRDPLVVPSSTRFPESAGYVLTFT